LIASNEERCSTYRSTLVSARTCTGEADSSSQMSDSSPKYLPDAEGAQPAERLPETQGAGGSQRGAVHSAGSGHGSTAWFWARDALRAPQGADAVEHGDALAVVGQDGAAAVCDEVHRSHRHAWKEREDRCASRPARNEARGASTPWQRPKRCEPKALDSMRVPVRTTKSPWRKTAGTSCATTAWITSDEHSAKRGACREVKRRQVGADRGGGCGGGWWGW
jgi:hypothetical protein